MARKPTPPAACELCGIESDDLCIAVNFSGPVWACRDPAACLGRFFEALPADHPARAVMSTPVETDDAS